MKDTYILMGIADYQRWCNQASRNHTLALIFGVALFAETVYITKIRKERIIVDFNISDESSGQG